MAAGTSAWATIQTMPNTTPTARVRQLRRPVQIRKRAGDLRSGVPGSSKGRRRTMVDGTCSG